MRTVYLAGPMRGTTYEEMSEWREKARAHFKTRRIQVLSPLDGKEEAIQAKRMDVDGTIGDVQITRGDHILARDLQDIRDCDVVLFNFTRSREVSVGSCVEFGYAKALGKTIVVAVKEYERTRYPNPHWHAFITEGADIVVDTFEEALTSVEYLLARRVL